MPGVTGLNRPLCQLSRYKRGVQTTNHATVGSKHQSRVALSLQMLEQACERPRHTIDPVPSSCQLLRSSGKMNETNLGKKFSVTIATRNGRF